MTVKVPANTPTKTPYVSKLTPEMEAAKWKPGQSGNPTGRPKKKPITELYEEMLNDPELVGVAREAIRNAIRKGSMAMVLQLKEMAERVEGKVVQPIDADLNISTLAERMQKARERIDRGY